ncbi:Acyltransferase [Aphelenchoides besseyi]|nr:Acyltransferase [Aphelenchoides besseyi]
MVTTSKLEFKSTDNVRLNLQGLRGVSILLILLFHLWPSHFCSGYLAVDVFFVLSGYLMTMFMDRIDVLTLSTAAEFYFRRIKRIVPIYLGVIAVVLLSATAISSPFDLHFLFRDTVPAILFYSNFPNLRDVSYFDQNAKFALYLHTWSLAVEMQFYLCVPPLFLVIKQLNRIHWTFGRLVVFLMIAGSATFQMIDSEDIEAKHVLLTSRLWQFGVGYVAFDLRSWHTRQLPFSKSLRRQFDFLIPMLLVVLMFVPQFPTVIRISITLLSMMVISFGDGGWLECRTLVELGNVSYSIYLVHWPFFTAHRYLRPQQYAHFGEIDIGIGIVLMAISMAIGFVVERLAKPILARITTWKSLLIVVGAIYFFICTNLAYVQQNSKSEAVYFPKEDAEPLLLKIWNERNKTTWTKEEVTDYNIKLLSITTHLKCTRKDEIELKNGQIAIQMLNASNACVEKVSEAISRFELP